MNTSILGLRIVSAALIIFIIIKIRGFLSEISQCGCSSQSFERIRFLELVMIGLIIIGLMFNTETATPKNMFKLANDWFHKIILPISMIIYLYLTYNVIQFSNDVNANDTCKTCGNKWEKYALYAQSALYAFSAAVIIIGGALFVNAGVTNITSGFGLSMIAGLLFILGLVATAVFGGSVNNLLDKVIIKEEAEGFCGCGGNKDNKAEGFCGCGGKKKDRDNEKIFG